MATYYITNTSQLNALLTQKVAKGLLEYVSKKVVEVMQRKLDESELSTRTLQTSVLYNLDSTGTESTIAIDYDFAQTFATPPEYDGGHMVEWGHLTTSLGSQAGSQRWNGELISFRLAQWLESGGAGDYGNQPIEASHWFTKTKADVQSNLSIWAKQYLSKYGLM